MCDSVSCYVMGCGAVHKAISDHLGIELGQTTPDDRFTLLPIVCLGACDKAPVVMIDDEIVGDLTVDDVPAVLERFR